MQRDLSNKTCHSKTKFDNENRTYDDFNGALPILKLSRECSSKWSFIQNANLAEAERLAFLQMVDLDVWKSTFSQKVRPRWSNRPTPSIPEVRRVVENHESTGFATRNQLAPAGEGV